MLPMLPATYKIPRQPVFPDVTFSRVSPGRLPNQYAVLITADDVARWARLHDDRSPWYVDGSLWGGPVAMPWILYYSSMNLLGHEFGGDRAAEGMRRGGGFARYRAEFLAPIPVGSTLTVSGEVTDKYLRRGRGYIDWRLDAWLESQLVQQHWKSWAFPTHPDDAVGWPEREGEGRPPEEPASRTLGPLSMSMTQERLAEFEGPIPPNLHSSPEGAAEAGLPAPLAQGELSFGLLCRLLRDQFGAGFVVGGSIDVRFIRPVFAGQTLTARGELLASTSDKARCRVWAENEAGEQVTVGMATAAQ